MSSDGFFSAELECLRLAADLTQMGRATSNPQLKAHFLQMAKFWDDRARRGWEDDASVRGATVHKSMEAEPK
jgi:hypothetical protein